MQFLRKYWLPIAAALILIVVAAAQCAPYMIEDMQRRQGRANVEALLAEGRYEEAQEEMTYWFMHGCNTDADYARYFLCHAYVAYENGNVDNADKYLRLSAKYRPERLWNGQTRAFAETVAEEAETLNAQQRAEEAAEAAAKRAAYEERVWPLAKPCRVRGATLLALRANRVLAKPPTGKLPPDRNGTRGNFCFFTSCGGSLPPFAPMRAPWLQV